MCVVSNISDYGQKYVWPNPASPPWWEQTPVQPWPPAVVVHPAPPPVKRDDLTVDEINKIREFLDLMDKARKFDIMTNQPDCQDEEKAQWETELRKRLERLEQFVGMNTVVPQSESNETNGPQFLQD